MKFWIFFFFFPILFHYFSYLNNFYVYSFFFFFFKKTHFTNKKNFRCGGGGCGKTRIGCYSKVNVEQFGMCSHPEDQKMDNVTLCKDDCAQNNDCLLCTSDKRKSCGWCRDSGSCRRGKSTGPSIIKTSCSSWRWNNGEEFEGTCALSYRKRKENRF